MDDTPPEHRAPESLRQGLIALSQVPPHLRERLRTALRSGALTVPSSQIALGSVLGDESAARQVVPVLSAMAQLGVGGPAAAEWIASLDDVSAALRLPELVWTGPAVTGLRARSTRAVYESLFDSAQRSVWVSTYAFFDGPIAFSVLAGRMDSRPALTATLLLNIQRHQGDTTTADGLVSKFADRFWHHDWPGAARPRVYYDPRALELGGPGGVLHAKAVVVDDEAVFVTSANLTGAALDKNIELGVVLRDRAIAASVVTHFRQLIEHGLLRLLPGG